MANYRLSESAADDLDTIYTYGVLNFGFTHTDQYTAGLISRFDEIAKQPNRYPLVHYIREGYRRSVFRAHSIYYKIINEEVVIIRILGRQNPDSQL